MRTQTGTAQRKTANNSAIEKAAGNALPAAFYFTFCMLYALDAAAFRHTIRYSRSPVSSWVRSSRTEKPWLW